MGKLLLIIFLAFALPTALTALYLLIRHFHRKWKWQDVANENAIRRAMLEEVDIQFEVADDGFIRPMKRSDRGHPSPLD